MRRWFEISQDPTAKEITKLRREQILCAQDPEFIVNRVAYLCQLATNKVVLDVGIVEHTSESIKRGNWLHGQLAKVSEYCLGVDILEDEINQLKIKGFNVICADLTDEILGQKFDLIVCGDILEHVDSPGKLLKNLSTMLAPNGRLVITIPNPWYINVILRNLRRGLTYVDNVDHVAWFDPATISELAARSGMLFDKFQGVIATPAKWRSRSANWLLSLRPLLCWLGFSQELFAKTIIYELVPDSDP